MSENNLHKVNPLDSDENLADKVIALGIGERLFENRIMFPIDLQVWMTDGKFVNDWRVFGALLDKAATRKCPVQNDWPQHAREGIEVLVQVLAHRSITPWKYRYRHTTRPYSAKDRDDLVKWLKGLKW